MLILYRLSQCCTGVLDPDVDGRLTADRDILFDTIFVDIRGITLQSAIMEWSIPEDERIFNLYIVSFAHITLHIVTVIICTAGILHMQVWFIPS